MEDIYKKYIEFCDMCLVNYSQHAYCIYFTKRIITAVYKEVVFSDEVKLKFMTQHYNKLKSKIK